MSNVIPAGWSTQRLGEVVSKFQNGNAFSSSGYVEDGIPIISMGCLGLNGQFNKEYLKQKCWSRSERESLERYIVKPFDLLMAMTDVTPTMELIGRSCIAKIEQEALLNQRVGLLRIDEEKACKYFISYVTNFDDWRSYAKGSSGLGAQANLGTQQILDGSVLFPPLPEQQKIAAILTSVDDVIESTQAQINKLKDLKTGMMQELLTKGIGHAEFKDTPMGRIPKAWKVVKLSNIADKISDGLHSTPEYVDYSEYIFVNGNNLKNDKIEMGTNTKF